MIENMETVDVKSIASEEMAKTLLESLILQIQMLKHPWQKMTQAEQDETIEALRKNVLTATDSAVRLISANGSIAVVGNLEQATIKDGVKAQVTIQRNAENIIELLDAVGKEVLIVCAANAVYDKGLYSIHGEDDQKPMDFGNSVPMLSQ